MRSRWLMAATLPLLLASASSAATINACGVVPAGSHVLGSNLTAGSATGACLRCPNPGTTIDLNGFSITYDNEASGIANAGFETGAPPTGWTVPSGAARVTTADWPMIQSWCMDMTNVVVGDSLVSPSVSLPASRLCSVSWITCLSPTDGTAPTSPRIPRIRLKVYRTGAPTAPLFNAIVMQDNSPGPDLISQYNTFTTSATPDTYRAVMIVEVRQTNLAPSVANGRVLIDHLDLRTAGNDTQAYGIYVQANGPPGTVVIKDTPGTSPGIIQGAGGGTRAVAIRVGSGTRVTNIDITTTGMEASAIFGTGSNIEVDLCTISTTSLSCFVRANLRGAIYLTSSLGPTGNHIHNNTVSGGGIIPISIVGGGSEGSPAHYNPRVIANTINATATNTNAPGIMLFNTNAAVVTGNTIIATYSQAFEASARFEALEVGNNTITMNGIMPNREYGFVDLQGIKLNDYNIGPNNNSSNLNIHDNTITIDGVAHTSFLGGTFGVDCSVIPAPQTCDGKYLGGIMNFAAGDNNVFARNTVNVSIDDPEVLSGCFECGFSRNTTINGPGTRWIDNVCNSNQKMLVSGGYTPLTINTALVNTTWNKVTPTVGVAHHIYSRRISTADFWNIRLVNNIFQNGADALPVYLYTQPQCYPDTPCNATNCTSNCSNWIPGWSYTGEWFLDLTVLNSEGDPATGIGVEIQNLLGTTVFTGVTGAGGLIENIELAQARAFGGHFGASTVFADVLTPHSIRTDITGEALYQVTMDQNREVTINGTINCCDPFILGCCWDHPILKAPPVPQ